MSLKRIVLLFLCFCLFPALTFPASASEAPLKKVLLQVPISLPAG